MKTFLLLLVLTDIQGNETIQKVSDYTYNSKLECITDKAQYKEHDNLKFFCAGELKKDYNIPMNESIVYYDELNNAFYGVK